jgi:hypothetical protein
LIASASAITKEVSLMKSRGAFLIYSFLQLACASSKLEATTLAPCHQIDVACRQAGFVVGKAGQGFGYWVHCVNPLIQGVAHPIGAIKPLPIIDSEVIQACRLKVPTWGRGQVGYAVPHPVVTPVSSPTGETPNGNIIKMKKSASYAIAQSGITYYKFLRTVPLPQGRHFLKSIKGKVQLRHTGDYTLSLSTLFSVPGHCPQETTAPFTDYQQLGRLMGQASYNLAQFILRGNSTAVADYQFPKGVPVSGCLVMVFDGGPLSGTSEYTMSADLDFELGDEEESRPPALLTSGWESWLTGKKAFAFATPVGFKSELVSVFGTYSMLGTRDSKIDYYLLPGGCGSFIRKDRQGRSQMMTTNHKTKIQEQLPANAKLILSIEKTGKRGLVQDSLSVNPPATTNLEAGDCLLSIMYAPSGSPTNGDFENQLKYYLVPR